MRVGGEEDRRWHHKGGSTGIEGCRRDEFPADPSLVPVDVAEWAGAKPNDSSPSLIANRSF